MSEAFTHEAVFTAMIKNGMSVEGAAVIAERRNEPRLGNTLRSLVAKINETVYDRFRRPVPKIKAHISGRLRKFVFERDAYRCRHCGDWHNLTVDHIIPESRGGTLDLENLQTLCRTCNCKKGDRITQ